MKEAPGKDIRYWVINTVCGLVVLGLLGVHMAIMHLDDLLALVLGTDDAPLDWAQVTARGDSLLFTVTYVLLLGTALFHGFYGLHTVLTEFWAGRRAARLIRIGCLAAGIVLFVVGTAATVLFYLPGAGAQ